MKTLDEKVAEQLGRLVLQVLQLEVEVGRLHAVLEGQKSEPKPEAEKA